MKFKPHSYKNINRPKRPDLVTWMKKMLFKSFPTQKVIEKSKKRNITGNINQEFYKECIEILGIL